MNQSEAIKLLNGACMRLFGCNMDEATDKQAYKALCTVVRNGMYDRRRAFKRGYQEEGRKQVYYMSMEFLVGTSLRNNLYNLGMTEVFTEALKTMDIDIEDLYALDPDAGLGNGGLGRLASCYLDALTGLGYPATGFSIRYEFGIFKQQIVDGWQMELPDNWLQMGDVWLVPKEDDAVEVRFGGEVNEWYDNGRFKIAQHGYSTVMAVPYNLYISGYHTDAVNKLVLWSAKLPQSFDMAAFSRGDYVRALEQNTMAETISKVLYPADDHIQGKRLRLKQQYLLCSASLQSILRAHVKKYGTVRNLPDKVAIHINDTHPALCVPELMRLLMDERDLGWDEAWDICCRTLSYTNHTVMSEALERWSVSLFKEQLPRVFAITEEINRRLLLQLRAVYGNDEGKLNWMAVIANGEVRMSNLCLACCHKINGVSRLHTEILEQTIFRDYYQFTPERFLNVTNGIAYRRWLGQANPKLTALLRELIGDGFMKDAAELEGLLKYKDSKAVLDELAEIKLENKIRLTRYIARANGIKVNPRSIFDVQVKRLHEYKRQFMNALSIMAIYQQIRDGELKDLPPVAIVFGAKAAPGYERAKAVIHWINMIAEKVNADPITKDRMKVVFVQNYNCSWAEKIIPAADISEQISPAGTEASGTGNMKLMLNGAVTLGTFDGANVEIVEEAGRENNYIFGATVEELAAIKETYDPKAICAENPVLARALESLVDGSFPDSDGALKELHDAILEGASWHKPDHYFVCRDFADYHETRLRAIREIAQDPAAYARKALMNVACAGKFSSDRTIRQYAKEIWHV